METTIIKSGQREICELCNKKAELRPYGPNGEWICFKCGMADEETTKKQFGALLNKGNLVIDARKS